MHSSPIVVGSAQAMTPLGEFLAGSASVVSALVERDGTIVDANPALEGLVGSVASIHEIVVPAQVPVVANLLARAGPSWRRSNGPSPSCWQQ